MPPRPFTPIVHPSYLPELMHRLKVLLPQTQQLHKLLRSPKVSAVLSAKAPLVAYLLEVLPLLPDLGDYDLYPPPPEQMERLLLHTGGKAHLSTELIRKLNLRAGQPATLRPPGYNSPYWHLDVRPSAPLTIDWYPGKPAKIKHIPLPKEMLLPAHGLTLVLVPGPPAYEGCYPMLEFNA